MFAQLTGQRPEGRHWLRAQLAATELHRQLDPLLVIVEGIQVAQCRLPMEVAATLRAGPFDRFVTVALPLSRRGLLTAVTLGFAHTLGEFGVVLMIGGNIPGRTRVLSIAIYDHVERLEYAQAHLLSGGMLLFSFAVLWTVYSLNRRLARVG